MNDKELKELLIAITLDIAEKYGDAGGFLQRLKRVMSDIGY